jgi:hypothetical protein
MGSMEGCESSDLFARGAIFTPRQFSRVFVRIPILDYRHAAIFDPIEDADKRRLGADRTVGLQGQSLATQRFSPNLGRHSTGA